MGGSLESISTRALSTHPDKCGEDVLDGVNADGAFGKGGSALDGLHFGDTSINEGLVG